MILALGRFNTLVPKPCHLGRGGGLLVMIQSRIANCQANGYLMGVESRAEYDDDHTTKEGIKVHCEYAR